MIYVLLILGSIGHAALWVALVNRLHSVDWRRSLIDRLTLVCGVGVAGLPVAILALFVSHGATLPADGWPLPFLLAWTYIGLCSVLAIAFGWLRLAAELHPERRGALEANHTTLVDFEELADEPLAAAGVPRLLAWLPGNEVFRVRVQHKDLIIPRLAAAHDGLKIAHLTDLHMSGRIAKRYFEEVVRIVNQWQPDLVALTGDLVERQECLDWIPDTLAKLRAEGGVYFILGNHDRQHVDPRALRAALVDSGLVDIGGRWQTVTLAGAPAILAGNELPWFTPAADLADCPPRDADNLPLRVVLAHSPDQFAWAVGHQVDLILAGHNHGGQICFPLVGPVLAPSRHGTRYAAGIFEREGTVLHVSRGTSGLAPIRWNCPPEIALLTLRASCEQETR